MIQSFLGAGATGPQGTPGLSTIGYSETTPIRTFNTNFMLSASMAMLVCYTIEITCTATLLGGQSGMVELRSDPSTPPSIGRCQVANSNSIALAIAITSVNTQRGVLSYLVPPNHYVRLQSAGNASMSLVAQSEVMVQPGA